VSIPVDLAALHDQIARCGPSALLVTTCADGPPHVSSVIVAFAADDLAIGAGKTTLANAAEHPAVALVWTDGLDEGYCMIVDAIARPTASGSEVLVVEPKSAVLHRLASAPSDLPRCLPVGDS
jgi:hypothetical protein